MQLSPSGSSASKSKVQPRYSGGIGVSGNETPLFIINPVSSAVFVVFDGHLCPLELVQMSAMEVGMNNNLSSRGLPSTVMAI